MIDIILSNAMYTYRNWSFRRKMLATSCVLVYTMMIAIPSSSVYSVVRPIETATGLELNDLNTGTGVMFLVSSG